MTPRILFSHISYVPQTYINARNNQDYSDQDYSDMSGYNLTKYGLKQKGQYVCKLPASTTENK